MHAARRQADPTFLVGAERSGTTVFRLMLDSHPLLAWANELEFAVDMMPHHQGWPPLEEYYEFLSTHRIFLAGGYRIDQRLDYLELMNSFLEQRARRAGKARVGATVHRHFDRLLRIWPDARFIHIVRDPRDVAHSCIRMGWAGNVWTGARRWVAAERLWDELLETIPAARRIDVRYEELIRSTEAVLTRVCQFIGIPYDPRMLDYPSRTTYEHPDRSLTEQWRTTFSERELRLVEARTGPLLTARGYEPSGLPPLHVTRRIKLLLQIQDRWARFRYSLALFGPRLRLANTFSRRLGLKSWQRSVRLRMNAIAQENLK